MKKLFLVFAVLVLAGVLFSCQQELADGNPLTRDDGRPPVSLYGSSSSFASSSSLRSSSSSYAASSSSLQSATALCVLGSSCLPIDVGACLEYGGTLTDVCPSLSSSSRSSNSVYVLSSSSLQSSMRFCVVGSSCLTIDVDIERETCWQYGTQVASCPVSSSSSSLRSSSSLGLSSSSSSSSSKVAVVTGSFTDSRDEQSYGTVAIGSQRWMAKNLNYDADGSKCYGEGRKVWDEETGNYIAI